MITPIRKDNKLIITIRPKLANSGTFAVLAMFFLQYAVTLFLEAPMFVKFGVAAALALVAFYLFTRRREITFDNDRKSFVIRKFSLLKVQMESFTYDELAGPFEVADLNFRPLGKPELFLRVKLQDGEFKYLTERDLWADEEIYRTRIDEINRFVFGKTFPPVTGKLLD